MSDIASAVERAKAVAAKLTAAAKANGSFQAAASAPSAPKRRYEDDDIPTSGYSKRENLYGSGSDTNKRPRDDDYKDIPSSGFKPKPGLGSDDATSSFLARLGLSAMVSTKISKEITIPVDMVSVGRLGVVALVGVGGYVVGLGGMLGLAKGGSECEETSYEKEECP
ncbi:hypothetical protein BC830DRAFT_1122702 [Chytriomyces sp. MP71]|nr:hypothetical protein BC830DRAFT_1122702 [Chytriomyces sp. MP71]